MVAPNGARLGTADHYALPVTIEDIVETAILCRDAGADGLHAHVRDAHGKHVLDAGLYLELLAECDRQLPRFYTQITTEAVGKYTPSQQAQLVRDVEPKAVSVALKEMACEGSEKIARDFYYWAAEAKIEVQHILYDDNEIGKLADLIERDFIPDSSLQLLFVLGRYKPNQQSEPQQINPFVDAMNAHFTNSQILDWAVCAFGKNESKCLSHAAKMGGKTRVGFENNLLNMDGSIATDNAERVAEIFRCTQF